MVVLSIEEYSRLADNTVDAVLMEADKAVEQSPVKQVKISSVVSFGPGGESMKGKKIVSGIILFVISIFVLVFIFNRIMLKVEEPLLEKPIGEMVEVDGHNMCVYTAGEGEQTIVFLSGSGTASPILDFKPLYERLADDYRIVEIEKFGCGFSDIVDTERSFDTILREDREALKKLGIEGPFILCPHSMSGLETILWAQNYPEEVEAIIGLDMSVPRAYDDMDLKTADRTIKLAEIARNLGFARLYYMFSPYSEELSREEKKLYCAIGSKIAANVCVQNEGLGIEDACNEIDSMPIPGIPTLQFVSDGRAVGVGHWAEIHKDYAANVSGAMGGTADSPVIELNCGHYVHWYEPERIAEEMKGFLQQIQ